MLIIRLKKKNYIMKGEDVTNCIITVTNVVLLILLGIPKVVNKNNIN